MAGSATLVAAAVPGGIASATILTSSCTTLTGNATTQHLSGCSGTALALTGTTGTITVVNHPATKTGVATIKWATAKTTIESYSYSELTGTSDKCPKHGTLSPIAEAKEKGTVTGGTATAMKGGTFTSTACAYAPSKGVLEIFNMGPVTQ